MTKPENYAIEMQWNEVMLMVSIAVICVAQLIFLFVNFFQGNCVLCMRLIFAQLFSISDDWLSQKTRITAVSIIVIHRTMKFSIWARASLFTIFYNKNKYSIRTTHIKKQTVFLFVTQLLLYLSITRDKKCYSEIIFFCAFHDYFLHSDSVTTSMIKEIK